MIPLAFEGFSESLKRQSTREQVSVFSGESADGPKESLSLVGGHLAPSTLAIDEGTGLQLSWVPRMALEKLS